MYIVYIHHLIAQIIPSFVPFSIRYLWKFEICGLLFYGLEIKTKTFHMWMKKKLVRFFENVKWTQFWRLKVKKLADQAMPSSWNKETYSHSRALRTRYSRGTRLYWLCKNWIRKDIGKFQQYLVSYQTVSLK